MMVYPVPGRAVRDPVTKRILTDEGLDVSVHDMFWARRLRDADVTTSAPVSSPSATAKSAATTAAVASTAKQGGGEA
jgi:hypothetical protein